MIGGAGVGAFIAANNGKAIKATFRILPRLRGASRYDQAFYMDLLALQFKLLNKIRREGMLGVERDIDYPEESELFSQHPRVQADALVMECLLASLRRMVGGGMGQLSVVELMLPAY